MCNNHIDSFQCKRCGTCCKWSGYVRLKENEITNIANFLGLSELEFIEKYTKLTSDRRGLSLIEKEDGSCIFFNDPPGCQINPVKPLQCRNFPLIWNFEGWEKFCKGNTPANSTDMDSSFSL